MDVRQLLRVLIGRPSGRAILVWVVLGSVQSACRGEAADDAAAQLEAAVTAIQHNYSQWHTIRATVKRVLENPGVTEKRVVSRQMPGGGVATITTYPKTVTTEKFVARGADFRYEAWESGEESPREVWTGRGGIITDYQGGAKMAWVSRPEDKAGVNFDPREVGISDRQNSLLQMLRDYKTSTVEWTELNGARVLRVVKQAPKGGSYLFLLDPTRNLLPIFIGGMNNSETYARATRIEYQEVAGPNAGWFPKTALRKGFAPGTGKDFDASPAIQTEAVEVTNLETNGAVADGEFTPYVPNGTMVRDYVEKRGYTKGEGPQGKPSAMSGYRILAWSSAAVAACACLTALVFFYLKRRRNFSSQRI